MARHQDGTILLRSNRFYVRYQDGDKKPIVFLAVKDADHWIRRRKNKRELSEKLEALRDKVMRQVNDRHGAPASQNVTSMTIGEFWEESFVPSWKDRELHASTTDGYTKTWDLYLKDHLSKRRLIDYRTPDASKFLTSLVTERKLGRNTLAHCRALMSNVFTHAKNHGLIASNPIHDVKIMARVRAPKATE